MSWLLNLLRYRDTVEVQSLIDIFRRESFFHKLSFAVFFILAYLLLVLILYTFRMILILSFAETTVNGQDRLASATVIDRREPSTADFDDVFETTSGFDELQILQASILHRDNQNHNGRSFGRTTIARADRVCGLFKSISLSLLSCFYCTSADRNAVTRNLRTATHVLRYRSYSESFLTRGAAAYFVLEHFIPACGLSLIEYVIGWSDLTIFNVIIPTVVFRLLWGGICSPCFMLYTWNILSASPYPHAKTPSKEQSLLSKTCEFLGFGVLNDAEWEVHQNLEGYCIATGVAYGMTTAIVDLLPYTIVYGGRYHPMSWTARLYHRSNPTQRLALGQLFGVAARIVLQLPSLGFMVRAHATCMPTPALVPFHRSSVSVSFAISWSRYTRLVLRMIFVLILVTLAIFTCADMLFGNWKIKDRLLDWLIQAYLDPIYSVLPIKSLLWFWYSNGIYALDVWTAIVPYSPQYEAYLRGNRG